MKAQQAVLIGCGASIGIFLILGVVVMIWVLSGPEGGVRLPNEMEAYAQEYLVEHKLLQDSEELLAYYDVTMRLDGTEAAILTTTRVLYHNNGQNTSINLTDIEDIRHRTDGLIGDVFEISSAGGRTMKIEIALFNQGETFKNVLMAAWDEAK